MPKRKKINGLPHNLIKSYFSTLRYHDKGYMADWLLNAAINLNLKKVTLDILNSKIDPSGMEKLPLLYHLKDLKNMLEKELSQIGFESYFITDAKIIVEIPNNINYQKTLYCYSELTDIEGRHYHSGQIIEEAFGQKFNPFQKLSMPTFLLKTLKMLFKIV